MGKRYFQKQESENETNEKASQERRIIYKMARRE